jgi:dTDP-L-rhamnose 4-epimerase
MDLIYPSSRSVDQLKQQQWEPDCPYCGSALQRAATPENALTSPVSIYAATKCAQENIVRIACEAMGIDSIIMRFQNVYGEGQSLRNPYTGILSIFSTRIRRGLSLPIFEDGKESRDFIHVSDIVRALAMMLDKDVPKASVYNVGSGRPTTVMELAEALVEKLGGRVRPHVSGEFRLGDIRHCFADLTRIRAELGFEPSVSLDVGLSQFVQWVDGQPLPQDGLDRANNELRERGLMPC